MICCDNYFVFFRSLISEHCVVLSDAVATDPIHERLYLQIKDDSELCDRMLPLRNIVQMLVLHSKSTGKYLVMANTHLYSQPNADNIRLVQAAVILNQIRTVIDTTIVEHGLDADQVSAIFCGDMNSEPSDPIHQLVTVGNTQNRPHSNLKKNLDAHACATGQQKYANFSVENSFRFQSAYDNTMHTIFTHTFASCLDYMYYSSDRHKLIQVQNIKSSGSN